jgi:hypothetical protein
MAVARNVNADRVKVSRALPKTVSYEGVTDWDVARRRAVIVPSHFMREVGDRAATSEKLDNPATVVSSPSTK